MIAESTLEVISHAPSQGEPGRELGSPCCCGRPASHVRAADVGLSLVGLFGWLALPKCPLCLAAYLAIFSGLSLSVSSSRTLYVALAIIAGGCFFAGACRLGASCRRMLSARGW